MKKTITLILALCIVISCFVACKKKDEDNGGAVVPPPVNTPVASTSTSDVSGDVSVDAGQLDNTTIVERPLPGSNSSIAEITESSAQDVSIKSKFIGTWAEQINIPQELKTALLAEGSPYKNALAGFDFGTCIYEQRYTFTADNKAVFSDNVNEIKSDWEAFVRRLSVVVAQVDGKGVDETYDMLIDTFDLNDFTDKKPDNGTYTVDDDSLTINCTSNGKPVEQVFYYTFENNNKLIFKYDGETTVLVRK